MFHLLEQEIAEHAGLQKIVLSAERFSLNVSRLISNLHATELPSPKLVVAVRPEHELARSMYLQIVKGSYSRIKARSSSPMPMDFATWFRKAGHRFGYHQLLAGWAKTYGSESLLFVPYLGTKSSIVEGISGIMGLPIDHMTVSTGMANPSIGHAAARVAVSCGQFGQLSGRIGLNLGRIVERARPKLRKCRLPGYEEAEIKQFFASDRERAFADLAGFRDAYLEASLA